MGSTPRPPPADPALGQAAARQARISEEQLKLSREQFATQRDRDKQNYDLAREQYGFTKDIMGKQMDWATQDRARMMETYRPLEDKIIEDARGWDQQDNMQRRAAQAQADVQMAIKNQNATTSQNMLNMGVNPNSGRFAGGLRAQSFQNAALQAGIQNQTRGQLLNEAQSMRHSAAGLGNPLIGASYAGMGAAGGNAQSLMSGQLSANQQAISGWNAGMQGMGQGADTNQSAFNMQNDMYKNQIEQWKAKMQNKAARTSAVIGAIGMVAAPFTGGLSAGLAGAMSKNSTFGQGMGNYWDDKAGVS